jgi:hypothetical protein
MTKLAKKTRTAEIRMGSHREVNDTIGCSYGLGLWSLVFGLGAPRIEH